MPSSIPVASAQSDYGNQRHRGQALQDLRFRAETASEGACECFAKAFAGQRLLHVGAHLAATAGNSAQSRSIFSKYGACGGGGNTRVFSCWRASSFWYTHMPPGPPILTSSTVPFVPTLTSASILPEEVPALPTHCRTISR